ncbi:hypothetical protein BPUTEOMOX_2877 [methanotrophic endosymbiont of Bathymodiolus puteoserpentis (Logatchev)]|nr:hypothetical protein BPUTEOMOX_2877 [methanotrophic endosymbiont of Bathymodiolus puteoserpentis (Logatchev)]
MLKPEGRAGTLDFGLVSPVGKLGAGFSPGGSAGVRVAGVSPAGKGGAA